MTVAELLERISSEELEEWRVYDACIEPIGDRRADLRAGVVAATVANCAPSDREREPYRPEDFALRFDSDGDPADHAADVDAKMRLLATLKSPKRRRK